MLQIFPNFVIIDNVIDNERFDKPLIDEFLDVVSPQEDKYCIVHAAFEMESKSKFKHLLTYLFRR
jgi:hypothetical protein